MDKCERAGKLFRGCKWQVIYNEQRPSGALESHIRFAFTLPKHLAELGVVKKTYVTTVCMTCGKQINDTDGDA